MTLVLVAEFTSLPEAQIAASVLRSADIEAVVMDGPDIALNPIAALRMGFRLMVAEGDLSAARQVLAAAEAAGDEAGEGD
ncbi:MAG TPA: DUF2007 domain-containing protein [Reyranella sp.]|nr:DUF2007 domain-containing protein [Reyranella sp.]